MKKLFKYLLLLLIFLFGVSKLEASPLEVIKGEVVAFTNSFCRPPSYQIGTPVEELTKKYCDKRLIVRTKKGEYVSVSWLHAGMLMIPDKIWEDNKIWTFTATRETQHDFQFKEVKYEIIFPRCGVGRENEVPNKEPKILSSYLHYTKYLANGEIIPDDLTLKTYVADWSKTKPSFNERLFSGTVNSKNSNISGVEVRVSFNGQFPYGYILTDSKGEFILPIIEGFIYQVRFDLMQKSITKTIDATKGKKIEPINVVIE
jgi:hypothetical protein